MKETTKWYQRHAFGSAWDKNICKLSFGYTHTFKKVAVGTDTAVHAAMAGSTENQTITTGFTDPDVPRVLTVKPSGTAGAIGTGLVIVSGTNIEGADITDSFRLVDGNTTAITGKKAFKTVTSVRIPVMDAVGASISIGTANILGINHRLYDQNTTCKIVQDTGSARTSQATPTITDADEQYIEKNLVTPATTPDGTTFLTIYYIYDTWSLGDVNDEPKYVISTSTSSTSSSTSTSSITTSTSSTSSSTSSTSISTSSTSSSTSSTSTSTTTVP